jgi:signal transduction histidine kinase
MGAVKRMTGMMEHILLLARIDSGTVALSSNPIDVAAWLPKTLAEIKSTCPSQDLCSKQCAPDGSGPVCPAAHEIRLVIDEAAALRRARIDESMLHHIVGNLFSNACKYSSPGGPIEITLGHADPHFTLVIRDHGIGIPADEHAHLFDGFFRGSNVGNQPGTGLGLAITRRCVDLLGGSIALDSQPGCGSTFTVILPLAPP